MGQYRRWVNGARAVAIAAGLSQGTMAAAQEGPVTAIELQPSTYETFTTANLLPRGVAQFELGFNQTNPAIDTPGTANQVYFVDVAFAPLPWLELGVDYMNFADPPPRPVAGVRPHTQTVGGGPRAKVRLYRNGPLSVAGQVSAEYMRFDSVIFGTTRPDFIFIGSAHLPLTYDVAPGLQVHLTPGVSVFPDSRYGNPFYGTVASIGGGVSWKPSPRTLVYASATMPLTGANTIMSDGSYGRRPVLTLGSRFAFAPNTAVEVWATNGFGMTPTSNILTFFPDGDIVMVGAKVVHTFGPGTPNKRPYGRDPLRPITPRQRLMSGDGFTLPGPRTRDLGTGEVTAFVGTHGARGAAIAVTPDHMFELRGSYERLADDGSGSVAKLSGPRPRLTGRFKMQLADQADGWPGSLAVIASFGRDLDSNGAFYAAVPMMYEVNDKLAARVVPEAAFFGNNDELGLGLGLTYALGGYGNLFGEYTLRNNGDDIWAVGAKSRLGRLPVEVGLHATNAIGEYGVNAMTSQDDPKVVLSVSVLQGLFR